MLSFKVLPETGSDAWKFEIPHDSWLQHATLEWIKQCNYGASDGVSGQTDIERLARSGSGSRPLRLICLGLAYGLPGTQQIVGAERGACLTISMTSPSDQRDRVRQRTVDTLSTGTSLLKR